MNEILDLNNIPKHIALILDGNGRWAKKRLLPRNLGHRKGAFNIKNIAEAANKFGVKVISLYCFSTENWNRPAAEVNYLMDFPVKYFKRYFNDIKNSNYQIRYSGRLDRIPLELKREVEEVTLATKDHTGLVVNVCFDYGSRFEITEACKKIASLVKENKLTVAEISENTIEDNLYTKGLGPVDLLIRTSGEERISNFLLWQCAYAEFYFTNVLWPDFDEEELKKAIMSYQKRNRRFGGLTEDKK